MKILGYNPHWRIDTSVSGQVTLAWHLWRALVRCPDVELKLATHWTPRPRAKTYFPEVDGVELILLNEQDNPCDNLAKLRGYDPDLIILGQGGWWEEYKRPRGKRHGDFGLWVEKWWFYIDRLQRPYMMFVHSEDDNVLYYANRWAPKDPQFRGFIYLNEHHASTFCDLSGISQPDARTRGTYFHGLELEAHPVPPVKEKLIISTGRPQPCRGHEFFPYFMPPLHKVGYHAVTYGSGMLPYLIGDLRRAIGDKQDDPSAPILWRYGGPFDFVKTTEDTPSLHEVCAPAMYHLNAFHQSRKRPLTPRMENTSIEAAMLGVIPLLAESLAPATAVHRENCLLMDVVHPSRVAEDILELDRNPSEVAMISEAACNRAWLDHSYDRYMPDLMAFIENVALV